MKKILSTLVLSLIATNALANQFEDGFRFTGEAKLTGKVRAYNVIFLEGWIGLIDDHNEHFTCSVEGKEFKTKKDEILPNPITICHLKPKNTQSNSEPIRVVVLFDNNDANLGLSDLFDGDTNNDRFWVKFKFDFYHMNETKPFFTQSIRKPRDIESEWYINQNRK
jgi:hypothetical protein